MITTQYTQWSSHHDCQAHCACGLGATYEFALPWSLHFESLGSRMQHRGFPLCRRLRVPAAYRRRAAGGAGVGAGMARAADAAAAGAEGAGGAGGGRRLAGALRVPAACDASKSRLASRRHSSGQSSRGVESQRSWSDFVWSFRVSSAAHCLCPACCVASRTIPIASWCVSLSCA